MLSLTWLTLVLAPLLIQGNPIRVSPPLRTDCETLTTNRPNTSLDTVFDSLQNDTVLVLSEGCYNLTRYRLMSNLTNITIQGEDAVITCAYGIGLAFFNIHGLKMEGITIEGCSLVGNGSLDYAFRNISVLLDIFYDITHNTKVGMFMANIYNLSLENITVTNNRGIGLLAINIMGNSSLNSVIFANNTPNDCTVQLDEFIDLADSTAGGLFLLYTDYHNSVLTPPPPPSLCIDQSLFQGNQQCSSFSIIPLVTTLGRSPSLQSVGFLVGGGAGLGLVTSQLYFSVQVTINNSTFKDNQALQGSVYIGQFQGSSGSNISISDSTFINNGFKNSTHSDYLRSNGGAISLSIDIPFYERQSVARSSLTGNTYRFHGNYFIDNNAYVGAGVYMIGLGSALTTPDNQNQVYFTNCFFRNNSATISPALYAFEIKYSGLQPGIQLYLHDIIVDNNNGQVNPIPDLDASIILTNSMNVTLSGQCIFRNNLGSSIIILTSSLHLIGNVTFEHNSATTGGAIIIFSSSYFILHNNSGVGFIDNTAANQGGAIYVKPTGTTIGTPCLLWFENIDLYCNYYTFTCPNPANLNIQIIFNGNMAPLGSALYGNLLSGCSWLMALQETSQFRDRRGFDILNMISNNASNDFVFDLKLINDRVINNDAEDFQLFSSKGNTSYNPIKIFPGQVTDINLIALDNFQQSVPLAITSRTNNSTTSRSRLGQSGYWFLSGVRDSGATPVTLYGQRQINTTLSIYSVTSSASTDIYFELQNCSYGFVFDDNTCICDESLQNVNLESFKCNETSGQITVPRFYWLGPTPAGNFTLQQCVFDYCKPGSITFTGVHDVDEQCDNNRGGILCGQCANEYSAVFGSTRCKKCDNSPGRIIGLIIAFIIAGIALVLAIAFLNITVTEGYLNGVIFYANLTQFFIPTFAQILGLETASLFVLISWINFETGFEVCFFDGMDTLTKVSLSFLFPGYLFLLMSIIICLARRSKRISRYGFSATRAFATLLLLCYSSVGTTCIKLLSLVEVQGIKGTYARWRFDPNIQYGKGLHGFCVFISIMILLVYIIPFALILVSPPKLHGQTKCGRNIMLKYKPIFDAFYHPFKDRCTSWIGFRCIIRTIPLVISGVTPYPTNVFGVTAFILCFLFLHEAIEPFKKKLQNKVETYFLINLLLFAVGTLYYPQIDSNFDGSAVAAAYIIGLVILAYSGLLVVAIIHTHIRFPNLFKTIKKYIKICCCCCCQRYCPKNNEKQDTEGTIASSINDDTIKSVSEAIPATVTYTELREPLLESGTAVVTSVKESKKN